MRREVVRKTLRLVVVLVIGMVMGRIVLPIFDPLTRRYLTIFPEKGERQCNYVLNEEVHYLGKLKTALGFPPTPGVVTMGTYTEGSLHILCRGEERYDDTILACECD